MLYSHTLLMLTLTWSSDRFLMDRLPAFAEVVLPTALSILAFHWTEKEDIK